MVAISDKKDRQTSDKQNVSEQIMLYNFFISPFVSVQFRRTNALQAVRLKQD